MRSLPIITALLTLLVLCGAVVGLAQAITVATDKTTYMPGESVLVSGTTVPGATVGIAAYNPKGTTVYFTMVTAGADGKYSATIKLPKTIPYEDWIYGTYTVEARVGTASASTTFTLAAASLVTGLVVDEKGNPVANAEVLVVETGASALTGKDGKFTVSTDVGTWTLRISKAGYLSTEVKVTTVVGTNDVGTIKITSLESLVTSLSAKVDELSKAVSDLSDAVSALQAQVPALANISSKLDELSAKLDSLSKAASDLGTKVDSISKAVSDLSAKVSSLDSNVRDALNKVTSTLDALRIDITGLRTDLKTVSDAMKNLATKSDVAAVGSKVDAVSSKVDALPSKADVAAVSSKVDAVSGAVGGLSGAVYAAVVLALLAFIMSLLVYMTVRKAITK